MGRGEKVSRDDPEESSHSDYSESSDDVSYSSHDSYSYSAYSSSTTSAAPTFLASLMGGLGMAAIWFVLSYAAAKIFAFVYAVLVALLHFRSIPPPYTKQYVPWIEHTDFFFYVHEGGVWGYGEPENFILNLLVYGVPIAIVLVSVFPHLQSLLFGGRQSPQADKEHAP